jgi:flagellar L-ring protein FlgH
MWQGFQIPLTLALAITLQTAATPATAQQLYEGRAWSSMASDQRASEVGDIVTVLIAQSATASSRLQNRSDRNTDVGGAIGAGSISEEASISFGGSFSGRGEVVRSDRFVAQMSAQIIEVHENGNMLIEGRQDLLINGEQTQVYVRGLIRPLDITEGNFVGSARLANAQINYDGEGFVSRSAQPGLLNRIFSFLGIG